MPSRVGINEILIIALIIFVLFGAKKLPEFVKGIGDAIKEIKKGIKEE
jgi:sec-independent protein translocase protein TatA